jgi:hypothetical protein
MVLFLLEGLMALADFTPKKPLAFIIASGLLAFLIVF